MLQSEKRRPFDDFGNGYTPQFTFAALWHRPQLEKDFQ